MTNKKDWTSVAARLLALLIVLAAATAASASTIDFESFAPSCPTSSSFSSVSGFTFSSNWVTECNGDYLTGWGNTAGAPSGVVAAGNSYAGGTDGVTMSRSQPFDLIGGMASSFLVNDGFDYVTPMSSGSLLIEGYLFGAFINSLHVTFDPPPGGGAPGYQGFGSIAGVNELRFFSSFDQDPSAVAGPDYWLIDNLQLNDATGPGAPVPEPSTLLLLASGAALYSRRHVSRAVSTIARRFSLPGKTPGA